MFRASIEKEELRKLPLITFGGEIHLIDSMAGVKKFMPLLMREEVLGFDTETRPAFRKGRKNRVSLLQLSTEFHAFLFRICSLGLPDPLIRLLEDGSVKKIGAAVHDDLKDLKAHREFRQNGFIELQRYVEAFGIENKAVAKMAGIVLGIRISKSQQLSNWDADRLSEAQLAYAATDAWVCCQIYLHLKKHGVHE